MPKAAKSSASSGTRKKHARKAAGEVPELTEQSIKSKPTKKQIKKGLAPTPKKSYIPPSKSKPAPVEVDPLDGLGQILSPDLLLVLRKLGKKDAVTKARALEELEDWVRRLKSEGDEGLSEAMTNVFPVWLHRYPALCVHPSRRIRHLCVSLHSLLLDIPSVRTNIVTFIQEIGSENQILHVLGSWCLSAWDIDRGIAAVGNRSWTGFFGIKEKSDSLHVGGKANEASTLILDDLLLTTYILPFVIATIMHPSSTYATLVPPHPAIQDDPLRANHRGLPRHGVLSSSGSNRKTFGAQTPESSSSKGEEQPEATEDRDARLRVSALGAIRWLIETVSPANILSESLHSALSSPAFWTVLNHSSRPPFFRDPTRMSEEDEQPLPSAADGFGHGQPTVRRAGWGVVHSLVNGEGVNRLMAWTSDPTCASGDEDCHTNATLQVISCAVLRSAFTEPDPMVRSSMWEPLLVFLTKFHEAWLLCDRYERVALHPDAHDEHDSDDESTHSELNVVELIPTPAIHTAYTEFLTFLGLGCNGSALQGYPTVLVILSTLPKEILSPDFPTLSGFFDALWSAIDGQALSSLLTERAKGTSAFLGAWGECLIWTAKNFIKGPNSSRDERDSPNTESGKLVAHELVNAQFEKLIGELGGTLRVESDVAGAKVAVVLDKVGAIMSDLLTDSLNHLSKYARAAIAETDDETRRRYAILFLVALRKYSTSDVVKCALDSIITEIAEIILGRYQTAVGNHSSLSIENVEDVADDQAPPQDIMAHARVLEILLEHFGNMLGQRTSFTMCLDSLLITRLSFILSQPSLIIAYLRHADDSRKVAVWHAVISTLSSPLTYTLPKRMTILRMLLDSVSQYGMDDWAKPQGVELQGLAELILDEAVTGDAASSTLMTALLRTPGPFIPASLAEDLTTSIVITLDFQIGVFIYGRFPSIDIITSSINLLLDLGDALPVDHLPPTVQQETLPRLFVSAFVLQHCASLEGEQKTVVDLARRLWDAWSSRANSTTRKNVTTSVKKLLKSLILDTDIRASPVEILYALLQIDPSVEAYSMMSVLPSQSDFDILLSSTSADPIDRTLAIIKPIIPTVPNESSRSGWNDKFDASGLSPYARAVRALLHVLSVDRQIAKIHMWTLQHVLTLALFASEVLQLPSADSPVFAGHTVAVSELREISRLAQQVTAFLSTHAGEALWHADVVASLSGKTSGSGELDLFGNFVKLVFEQSKQSNTVRDSLVLHTVLQHVLSSADKTAADKWIDLARDIDGQALQTALAISLAVTEFTPEPPRLDRYRNELASKLTGIPASRANTTGMRLLRCLCAVAPNHESDVIFLPQQRVVFLVQALQNWFGSDEELEDCVESEVTLLLSSLAPILQHVQGSHWEFIMELIESNIENSSFKDADTLVLLSRTLRLLAVIRDLALMNKYLKELWSQWSKVIYVLIRDVLTIPMDHIKVAVPHSICREQALSVIEDLPSSLMNENTLSKMCHLLTEPAVDNQKMAYRMLQHAAAKRTEYLVIEAGVDADDAVIVDLPKELLLVLQSSIDLDGEGSGHDPFAYLLAWMLTLDLFLDASVKVKTAYVDQMRTLDLIDTHLLPNVFEILSVGNRTDTFKLDPWIVDEYWLPMYDLEVPQSLQLLAAHIYFRALTTFPSLIRTWWEGLKDRQLSAAINTYTSSYFSPVLIASELDHLKPVARSDAGEEPLADEVFSVKIALAINEVTASFAVDDQRMEIGIKLPVGYPLRTVEVRPINKVGVTEKVWRRWLFAVQQVVTTHNGHIADGLALFKKTVSLHFEGQAECPICYSILHVVDRSLPTKPCKTCKNRFHAACLYKWFNTSHSSSCPLCRSDVM